ncbi:MAG TPA: hypothetical protein VKB51_05675 [bacterium]|nr:hypothetical protein [bacterium]
MAAPSAKSGLSATPPTFAIKGAHNSILLEMTGLGQNPPSGRLLRGLSPYLDEQEATHVFLLTERRRREPWSLQPDKLVTYQEIVHWARGPEGESYRGVVSSTNRLGRDEVIQAFEYEPLSLIEWAARRLETAVVSSREPILLDVCYIPKPWGREGWYTGIEKRGVSRVRSATGVTSLPYALGMFPVPISGEKEEPPILVKTLEPLPEPVYGDLYLEVHREKWETYVVLQVNREAWPDGVGGLRAGLHPEVMDEYRGRHGAAWEDKLSADLVQTIRDYEQVRRSIDDQLDAALREREANPQEPVAPDLHRELLAELPDTLRAEEERRRAAVERFLGKVPLHEGSVVTLPPGVLHSLQHGVKVIEFQTPTYERLIAMFAQKVLTQPHWDVQDAVALMEKAPYEAPAPEVLTTEEGLAIERIVDFPQFVVDRVMLEQDRVLPAQTEGNNQYQLTVVTQGKGELALPDGRTYPLEPEVAYLLPAAMGAFSVKAIAAQGLTYLRCSPRLEANKEPPTVKVSVEDALERTW